MCMLRLTESGMNLISRLKIRENKEKYEIDNQDQPVHDMLKGLPIIQRKWKIEVMYNLDFFLRIVELPRTWLL